MKRPMKVLGVAGLALASLAVLIIVSALILVQTGWFRETMRRKIIAETGEATGGTVTLGSFDFEVRHLRATVTDFVIHGKEPAGSPPFLRIARAQVDLRLFGIAYLGIEQPQVHIVLLPDGTTNIPSPRTTTSSQSPLATVVDLAVRRFDLSNGTIGVSDRKQSINLEGNNLRALLNWNALEQSYQGQISMEPIYVISGRNTPVTVRITLPAVLERDRILIRNAQITTPQSDLRINASIEDMNHPRGSARVNGHAALADLKNIGNLPIFPDARGVPQAIDLDAGANFSPDRIQITGLRASAGRSSLEASGTLENSLQFKCTLALGELGRLAKLSVRPQGDVVLNGAARFDSKNDYQADGNIEAENVSLAAGRQSLRGIHLFSALHVDPHNIDLRGFRLAALGAGLTGNAALTDLVHYRLSGDLRNFDPRPLLPKFLPYDGIVSGAIDVTGDLKTPGMKSLTATTHLNIAPGRNGIPVSGRLNAEYRGANDRIALTDSFLALPHSTLTLSGSVDRQLNVTLTSTNLKDFPFSTVPVKLDRGRVTFAGSVTGRFTAPRISGHLAADRFNVEGREFDRLQADLMASPSRAAIANGSLARAGMRASFEGAVGLDDWTLAPRQSITAQVQVRDADLADIVALAGEPPAGYSGALNADAQITGTGGNPQGSATIQIADGTLDGQPFDRFQASVNMANQIVTVPAAYITSGASHIDFSGRYGGGRVSAHVQSNAMNLAGIKLLQQQIPDTSGSLQINADLAGNIGATFLLSAVNGSVALRGLRIQGQNYGDLTASAHTNGQSVSYQATSDFSGGTLRVNGSTELAADYPTIADAAIRNLPIAPFLAQAKGMLSGNAHFSGTVENPQGNANLDLTAATIYGEPLDRVHAQVTYLADSVSLETLTIAAGRTRIDASARYDHPPADFASGKVQFHINSNRIDLARIHNLQKLRPGLGGSLEISTDGVANLRATSPRILLSSLNAKVDATQISAGGKSLGNLDLTTSTSAADRLNFNLQSNLAGASINGNGTAQLDGNYPVSGRLVFKNVTWAGLQPLLGSSTGVAPSFEGAADGQVTVDGPALDVDQLRGTLALSRLSVTSVPRRSSGMKPVGIRNDGTIQVSADHGEIRIENVRFTGTDTTVQVSGTASLSNRNLNLAINADANLALLRSFDQDIDSAGKVVVAASIRGTTAKPLINGTLELRKAALHYATFANGISNANGTLVFNGSSANIRNLSAETGGGTVVASGFVGYTDKIRFGLETKVSNARILIQQGVSVVTRSDIHLTGTMENSLASGTVTIESLNYRPQSDIGSILSIAAPPVQADSGTSPFLTGMRLDIRVLSAPALAVQASLAQNLQADADLRIRGTAAQPGVLGRITISEGKLVFFGNTYTVNSGSIGFFNPVRIDPVLDISLETKAMGVDVVLNVTGPIDNLKLSYTSDPPLQFQEIVGLLAAGQTPTSDPTLLANQPTQPQQTYQQMGESALLDQAIASPVSSRLQRVFGVTQLKIDPTFIEGSQLPQARVSLQQQITSNVTFTYVSALNDPNTTVIRVEWAFSQQWSAVASRDENGIFSINFFYKKQFH